jgi:RNA polymerase sigma factor (sigma-70 family)
VARRDAEDRETARAGEASASDFELLDRWAGGDVAAANALFERYFEAVYRFFCNKASRDIEDLVQETFAACVAGKDRFRRDGSFRSYLFGTARNLLLHHYRQRRPASDLSEIGDSRLVDLDPSPSAHVGKKQEERLLLEALRQLSLDHQIVIELHAWEQLSGSEVAEALGITEAAMRSRLHRAKLELRRHLEALSASPEVLESTLANLDEWAQAIRALR